MIENFRKYTGLIIVVVVLVFLGLVFFFDSGFLNQQGAPGGGGPAIRVDGQNYSRLDYNNLGLAPMQLLNDMPRSQFGGFDANALEMMRFGGLLTSGAQTEEAVVQSFFTARVVLRKALDQFGIHPSDQDVAEFIQQLSGFQTGSGPMALPDAEGTFDQAKYNDFIQKFIGRYGLNERDFQLLVRDVIATRKLREVVGSGFPGNRELAAAMAVVNSQQITAGYAGIDIAAFAGSIQPEDAELIAYWETVKDAFMTEKRIRVSYFIAAPEYPEDVAEKAETDEAGTTPDEDSETAPDAATEARRLADNKLARQVDEFLTQLELSEGAEFDSLVGSNAWELVASEWFTRPDVPEALQISTRSAGKSVADQLFDLSTGPDALAPFTKAIAVADNRWFIARLDEVEEARVKTFEEAREEVLKRYISEKAGEALRKEVESRITAIKEAIAGGKSFADAAREAGLEPRQVGPFAISDQPDGVKHPREIFTAAATVNPGEIAEPVFLEDQALIIFVENREIVKDESRGQQIDSYLSNQTAQNENSAFSAWLMSRISAVEVETKGR